MIIDAKYNGGLTAEQFLFYEIRIVSKLYLEGKSIDEIVKYIQHGNLFQYPTEREVSRLARACYKRIVALGNNKLVFELANAPVEVAKQINLYAMMCYNRLVREFMIDVIGEKYRQHAYTGLSGRQFRRHPDIKPETSGHLIDQLDFTLKLIVVQCFSYHHKSVNLISLIVFSAITSRMDFFESRARIYVL